MKIIIKILFLMIIVSGFIGCYKQIPREAMAPVEVEVVELNAPPPSPDESDILITTHIKKASYLLSPRTAETPYTFTLSIDGNEFIDKLKGVEEVESNVDAEKGEGVHYVLKKRIRLKPGIYEFALKSEDGPLAEIKKQVIGGKIYTLRFEPVYGPRKYLRPKHFREGVVGYEFFWDKDKY